MAEVAVSLCGFGGEVSKSSSVDQGRTMRQSVLFWLVALTQPVDSLRHRVALRQPVVTSHVLRTTLPRNSRSAVVLCEAPKEPEEPAAEPVTLQERLRLFWRLAVPYFEQAEGAKLNFGLMLLLVLLNSSSEPSGIQTRSLPPFRLAES